MKATKAAVMALCFDIQSATAWMYVWFAGRYRGGGGGGLMDSGSHDKDEKTLRIEEAKLSICLSTVSRT